MANGWDINLAAQAIAAEHRAVRATPSQLRPVDYQTAPSRTVGGSRLRAGQQLIVRLQPEVERHETFGASNAAMLTLLGLNGWVLQAAEEDFIRREGNMDDIVDRLDPLRLRYPNDTQRDERLAEFISLASPDSWYSALRFLQRHNWDFVRAVDAWIRQGYLPFSLSSKPTAGKKIGQYGMREIASNRPFDLDTTASGDSGAAPVDKLTPTPSNPDPPSSTSPFSPYDSPDDESIISQHDYHLMASLSESESETPNKVEKSYGTDQKGRKGYVIDLDRRPAKRSCPDPSKLKIEWIKRAQYKCKWFPGSVKVGGKRRKFRWNDDDRASNDDTVEFDWNQEQHISSLNRWREQELRRITGEATKKAGVAYNELEQHFLWNKYAMWTEERFWKRAKQEPSRAGDTRAPDITNPEAYHEAQDLFASEPDLRVPSSVIAQWTDEFNATFAGKDRVEGHTLNPSLPQGMVQFDAPRPERPRGSIDIQTKRIRRIGKTHLDLCEDFGIKYQPAHAKAKNRKKKADEGKAGDSDGENQSEAEGGAGDNDDY